VLLIYNVRSNKNNVQLHYVYHWNTPSYAAFRSRSTKFINVSQSWLWNALIIMKCTDFIMARMGIWVQPQTLNENKAGESYKMLEKK